MVFSCVWAQLCPFPNQTHSEPGLRSLKQRQSSLWRGSREPPFKLPLTSSCGDCLYEPHVSILSFPLEEQKRQWTHTEQKVLTDISRVNITFKRVTCPAVKATARERSVFRSKHSCLANGLVYFLLPCCLWHKVRTFPVWEHPSTPRGAIWFLCLYPLPSATTQGTSLLSFSNRWSGSRAKYGKLSNPERTWRWELGVGGPESRLGWPTNYGVIAGKLCTLPGPPRSCAWEQQQQTASTLLAHVGMEESRILGRELGKAVCLSSLLKRECACVYAPGECQPVWFSRRLYVLIPAELSTSRSIDGSQLQTCLDSPEDWPVAKHLPVWGPLEMVPSARGLQPAITGPELLRTGKGSQDPTGNHRGLLMGTLLDFSVPGWLSKKPPSCPALFYNTHTHTHTPHHLGSPVLRLDVRTCSFSIQAIKMPPSTPYVG